MTPAQIKADVDRGLELVAQIDTLKKELKGIEDRLETAGLEGDHVPLEDKDREGKQFLAKGSSFILPVVFESDLLVASMSLNSEQLREAETIAGSSLKSFYVRPLKVERVPKDGKAFRTLAADILGLQAPAFVKACVAKDKSGIAKSRTVIQWDRAVPI